MYGLVIDDRRLNFSSSHFIIEHDKCERLHGHNYGVKVELEAELDTRKMVADFKEAKDLIAAVCDKLDHRILIPKESADIQIQRNGGQAEITVKEKHYSFPESDCIFLPISATTAEEIARYIYEELRKDMPQIKKVYVSESDGSTAYYTE